MSAGAAVADRMRNLLKEHWLFAAVLAGIVASRIPFLLNLHEIVLMGQDFNPEHFGRLFLYNDIPAADDSEVGENARTFSLVSIYYWLPVVLYKLGVPFEVFFGLHALIVLPLVAFGMYRLALALFGDGRIACLAVLVFLFKDFALFALNLGYPIALNTNIYHSDAALVFVLFSLAALVERRIVAASLWIGGLALFNPTSAGTLTLVYGLYLLLSGRLLPPDRRTLASFGIIGAGALLALASIKAATPISNPAPAAAREFAILSSYHFTPHIISPAFFLLAQSVLTAGLCYAFFTERALARTVEGDARAAARHLNRAVIVAYVLLGWVTYWALFVGAPVLMIALAPAKIYMIAAIYVTAYAAYALYGLAVSGRYAAFLVIAAAALYLGYGHRFGPLSGVWILALGVICAHLAIAVARRQWRPPQEIPRCGLFALMAVLCVDFGAQATRVFRSGELVAARAFHEIQTQIHDRIPNPAIFVPFRYPGTVHNQYGPFRSWPFRTYSRRGGYVFWPVGRNMYYNSARHHQLETGAYAAFGIDLWDSVLREADAARRQGAFFYYTGLGFEGGRLRIGEAPIWTAYIRPINRLEKMISEMTFDQYMQHAAKLGATHVIVSRDPGMGPEFKGLVQNDYFVVVPVK